MLRAKRKLLQKEVESTSRKNNSREENLEKRIQNLQTSETRKGRESPKRIKRQKTSERLLKEQLKEKQDEGWSPKKL